MKAGPILSAAGMVAIAIASSVFVSFLVDRASLVEIYKERFDFHPGSWVGERITRTMDPQHACLIVGASTARQGFDPEILEAGLPGVQFLNAGTTGAAIEVLEIEAQIIARYDVRYHCIIAAVHPWLMKQVGLPELVDTEYVSQLRLVDVLGLSHYWWTPKEWLKLATAYSIPLKKHAPQMNKMMRSALLDLRNRMTSSNWTMAKMEFYPGELTPAPDFSYGGNPNYLRDSYEAYVKTLTDIGWYDRDVYVRQESIASLEHALDTLIAHADQVIVITMPDTTIWNEPNKWSKHAFEELVRQRASIFYADCQMALSDTEFVDHAHANDDGRRVMSEWLAGQLPMLENPGFQMHCPALPAARMSR